MILKILLAIMMVLLDIYVLLYLKWMDTENILITVEKTCPLKLKMIMYW